MVNWSHSSQYSETQTPAWTSARLARIFYICYFKKTREMVNLQIKWKLTGFFIWIDQTGSVNWEKEYQENSEIHSLFIREKIKLYQQKTLLSFYNEKRDRMSFFSDRHPFEQEAKNIYIFPINFQIKWKSFKALNKNAVFSDCTAINI
jgi:hypothetical protein